MSQFLPSLQYVGHEYQKLTLHLFLQIIGKIRLKKTPRKNHWWYITEYIDTQGFTTGPIPYDEGFNTFTITLNIHIHQLEIQNSLGDSDSFRITPDLTVADFYTKLMNMLEKMNIHVAIVDKPYDLGIDKAFNKITEYHHYDKDYTSKLWQALLWIDGVFKEFSGRFYGKTCPVHLYWHSMDIAVTRFSGRKAPPADPDARLSDKDAYSHENISFGFWPGDDNMREPAFYSYTYPSPQGLENEGLKPNTAFWFMKNGSPMAILKYSDLCDENNPRQALLNFMESAYQAGAGLANWDIKEQETPALSAL